MYNVGQIVYVNDGKTVDYGIVTKDLNTFQCMVLCTDGVLYKCPYEILDAVHKDDKIFRGKYDTKSLFGSLNEEYVTNEKQAIIKYIKKTLNLKQNV
jgi:hypothetical protein